MRALFSKTIFYLLLIVFAIFLYVFIEEIVFYDRIYPRVYLGEIDVGGLKKNEVKELVKIAIDQIEREGIIFFGATDLGEKKTVLFLTNISPSDPDLSYQLVDFKLDENINKAYQIVREDNFLKKAKKILETSFKNKKIKLETDIKEKEIENFLDDQFKKIIKKPSKPRLEIEKGEIILKEAEDGIILNFEKALKNFKENIADLSNKEIQISSFKEISSIKKKDCEELFEDIKTTLTENNFILTDSLKKKPLSREDLISWIEFEEREGKVEINLNQERVFAYLEKIASEIETKTIEPKFKMDGEQVVEFIPPQKGLTIDKENTFLKIEEAILNKEVRPKSDSDLGSESIEIVLKGIEPITKIENINNLGIKEIVGRGESNFAGSSSNRRYNIKVGAGRINGLLIKPDEEFSLVKALGRTDETTGFLPELVIKGNRTIKEFGGGLCQLGTTAFRVALDAGLPITERTPHTFWVRYYEPAGMDATIYNPRPDFRFINDTGNYLLLITKIQGDKLIFELYGTSDGRQVEMTKPAIYNIVSPPAKKIIYMEELPIGQEKKVESAVPGADTEFKRTVTFPNGTKREEVWRSHYVAWSEMWLVGGKPPKKENGGVKEENTTSTTSTTQ